MVEKLSGTRHTSSDDLRRTREPSPETNPAKDPKLQLDAPSLSLPKGGGAIRSIDEKFTLNPSNGTAALSLPLPMTPSRNGFLPPVKLSYNSGNGNSVLGIGWSLDMPFIARRTDHRLPRYRDDDVFLLQGEELVASSTWKVDHWEPDVVTSGKFSVHRYRSRVEGGFSRIEKIFHPEFGIWWRVTTRDNITTFFGLDGTTRIVDPDLASHVFQWLPALLVDDQGNCLVYQYKSEDLASVPHTLSEANRHNRIALFANKYLKTLRYGNRKPYMADALNPYRPAAILVVVQIDNERKKRAVDCPAH